MPTMNALIDRRILVNYTADADVVARLLPEPFRPRLSMGHAVVGICLIRLAGMKPVGLPLPRWASMTTENAAHRVAVEWDTAEGVATGVYVPRRDTDSRVARLLGGRVFPGDQRAATFDVAEAEGRYRIAAASADGTMSVRIDARETAELPAGSAFADLEAASAFFRCDDVGYSPSRRRSAFDAMRLDVEDWRVTPLACDEVRSSYFEDSRVFPAGTVEFDHALLMRRIAARWLPQARMAA
jgi:hypothetical protein